MKYNNYLPRLRKNYTSPKRDGWNSKDVSHLFVIIKDPRTGFARTGISPRNVFIKCKCKNELSTCSCLKHAQVYFPWRARHNGVIESCLQFLEQTNEGITYSHIQEILQHFRCHLRSNLNLGNHYIAELLNTNELTIMFDNKIKYLESGLIFCSYSLRKSPWYSRILGGGGQ